MRSSDTVRITERAAFVEIIRSHFLSFRTVRPNLLFEYINGVKDYREKKFSKFTDVKEMRSALVKLFLS